MSSSDPSGILRFLTDELQDSEDANERGKSHLKTLRILSIDIFSVWIMGHVLSGWDGTNGLLPPTNLFYQIVDRYSHVIASIFWGHTHEDQLSVR
jgi:sphingomyelin phosphodiesterase